MDTLGWIYVHLLVAGGSLLTYLGARLLVRRVVTQLVLNIASQHARFERADWHLADSIRELRTANPRGSATVHPLRRPPTDGGTH